MIAKLDDSRSLIKSSSAFEHRKKDQQCHDFEQEGKTIDRRQVATEDLLTSLLVCVTCSIDMYCQLTSHPLGITLSK